MVPLWILQRSFLVLPSAKPEDYLQNPITLLGLRNHPYYFNTRALQQFLSETEQVVHIPGSAPMFAYHVGKEEQKQSRDRRREKRQARPAGWKNRYAHSGSASPGPGSSSLVAGSSISLVAGSAAWFHSGSAQDRETWIENNWADIKQGFKAGWKAGSKAGSQAAKGSASPGPASSGSAQTEWSSSGSGSSKAGSQAGSNALCGWSSGMFIGSSWDA